MISRCTSARKTNANWNKIDNFLIEKIKESKRTGSDFGKLDNRTTIMPFSERLDASASKVINSIKHFFH